ncbi:MAG: lytic transglycosylase domain-containing protein [Nitrospinae bacterium]|nr:lytic transglycosylase domain-containing protein [Nitrospinota bacterium]
MLDLNIIERMQSAISSSAASPKEKFSKNNFYSLLIKHQLNMIQAWSPSQSDSSSGIPDFTQSFQEFKNNQNLSASRPNINTVLQSYSDANISKTHSPLLQKQSLPELVNRIAQKNNIPENLFQKLIQTESAFDPDAKSSRGAMGLGQLMPATAKELGLNLKEDHSIGSVLHPESNLDASARYLRKLFDKYTKEGIPGDEAWNFAAGAYNAGMGNIAKAIEKVGQVSQWDQVAAVLPQVTGKYSSETIRYVNRLRA